MILYRGIKESHGKWPWEISALRTQANDRWSHTYCWDIKTIGEEGNKWFSQNISLKGRPRDNLTAFCFVLALCENKQQRA